MIIFNFVEMRKKSKTLRCGLNSKKKKHGRKKLTPTLFCSACMALETDKQPCPLLTDATPPHAPPTEMGSTLFFFTMVYFDLNKL